MTLKDIAKEANVSSVTVSNVINGKYSKVSKETVQKVQDIIEKYNYKPNATARSLAMKKSKIIGVIIPNIGADSSFLQSPYNSEVLSVLEQQIRKQDYYLMIRCVGNCSEVLPLFSTWNVDGMIFVGAYKEEVHNIVEKVDIPTVFIDSYSDTDEFAGIVADDYKGGYLATKYLLARGHKNIIFAGPNSESQGVVHERFLGYCDAMKEKELPIEKRHIYEAVINYEAGIETGKQIAFSSPEATAVVSTADILALGIMEGLRLSGKMVPEEVSIVGFDNSPECSYCYPKLTTVSQNITRKAEHAAEYLFEMIAEEKSINVQEKVDVEIIERQSVKTI